MTGRDTTGALIEFLRREAGTRTDIHGFVATKPETLTRAADAYERAIAALKDVLDAAERDRAGFPIESEEWYARRDYARIQIEDSE